MNVVLFKTVIMKRMINTDLDSLHQRGVRKANE
jgi:hypothetical protein